MTFPLIGITANTNPASTSRSAQSVLSNTYVDSIILAGGAPVIIPPSLQGEALRALFARLDGVLISGGSDLDPARYGGEPHPRVYGIDSSRDEQEIALIRLSAEERRPFLGICRGIQAVNVALGGTLFTDIGDQKSGALRHDCYPDLPRDYLAHEVIVDPASTLANILGGKRVQVNSLHHQGIRQAADMLRPVAQAPDGLIEAVELPGHPFGLGVQWHPECLPEHEEQRALFRSFVQAAAEKGER